MSNKKQQKDKIKAKQRSMQEAMDGGGQSFERQTEGLNEVVSYKDDNESDAKKTSRAVNKALDEAKMGKEVDPRLVQLFKDFKLYRILVIAIVAIGFIILLAAMYLYSSAQIDADTQNNIIIFANLVIVLGLVIAFGRARPIREDINAWSKVNEIALKNSHGEHGATQADIDKIFLSRARNKRVPPIPEFKRFRRVWYGLLIGSCILLIAAAYYAQMRPGELTIPITLVVIATIWLVLGTVIERVKMKPLREAWVQELDAKVRAASKKKRR